MISAVVHDVSYDTRMIKKRKNMVIVRPLTAIKEKKNSQDIDRSKILRF